MPTQLQQLQSAVATLQTNARSNIGPLNRDSTLRAYAFALLKKNSSTVTDVAGWLSQSVPSAFQGWNDELQLDSLVYLLALNNGLPTSGPALQSLVDQATGWSTYFPASAIVGTGWGVPNGIVDAQTVQGLIYYAQLLNFGAAFPVLAQV